MDRYSGDPLATNWRRPKVVPEVAADDDLVVEEAETGFCGAVVGREKGPGGHLVTLEDGLGRRRVFPLGPGYLIDGQPVTLIAPAAAGPTRPTRTASGSVAVAGARARVARESRIYVEGKHDAELVEKVWGDDLRIEGVVVEYLEGVDHLPAIIAEFAPDPTRRLGVLVDHLVHGSKESRIAASIKSPHVLIVGHPFVDIWEAVKPNSVGIRAWPKIPPGQPWKEGVLEALGWYERPSREDQERLNHLARQPGGVHGPEATELMSRRRYVEPYLAWKRILGGVRSWTDLEPELIGRVEELIDFVSPGAE